MINQINDLKRRDPALRIYTANALLEASFMTNEQYGMYMKLLFYQHQYDHIPEGRMQMFCGGDSEVMSKFIKDERGLYYNKEVDDEMMRRKIVIESKRNNAKSPRGGKQPNDE
jgi:hypothetical protein